MRRAVAQMWRLLAVYPRVTVDADAPKVSPASKPSLFRSSFPTATPRLLSATSFPSPSPFATPTSSFSALFSAPFSSFSSTLLSLFSSLSFSPASAAFPLSPTAFPAASSATVTADGSRPWFDAPAAVKTRPNSARVQPTTAHRSAVADGADALERAVARVGAEAAVFARMIAAGVEFDVASLAAESGRTGAETTTVWTDITQSCTAQKQSHTIIPYCKIYLGLKVSFKWWWIFQFVYPKIM